MGDLNIVGQRVMHLRKEKGIKQKDLGGDVAKPRQWIFAKRVCRAWKGQTRKVQDYELPIIAEALDVSVEWLLSEE